MRVSGETVAVATLTLASLLYAVLDRAGPVAALLTIAQTVPLLWYRIRPTPVFTLVAAVFVVHIAILPAFLLADVALLIALYATITVRGWRPDGWAATAATAACFTGAMVVWGADRGLAGAARAYVAPVLGIIGAITATCLLAELARTRGQRLRMWQERAVSAERERHHEAIIAAQAERARIAREIHDVVAHALVIVTMHAEGAQRAIQAGHPDAVEPALDTIAGSARDALAETRDLVKVLATESDPAPVGLELLEPMVHSLRQAGQDIRLTRRGQPTSSPAASHTAYRVIQEAVTNSLRHAGHDATLHIQVRQANPDITVIVDDNGTGNACRASTGDPGNGLRGLRDRVEHGGGRFEAGPRPEGGFHVWAQIPANPP